MLENIALIQQVHQKRDKKSTEKEATEALEKIGLHDLGNKRINQVTTQEIFYVMLLRASMMECDVIVVTFLFSIYDELQDLEQLYKDIQTLRLKQDIIFVDWQSNSSRYEGLLCSTIKWN